MAVTLKAAKVLEALRQAKGVGRVEEAATIAGCSMVFSNLTPADYNAINEEIKDFDEVAYLHAYQIGHICRSVVELADQDLRDVKYIEEDVLTGSWGVSASVPDKKVAEEIASAVKKVGGKATILQPDGKPRTIKIERHEWLRNFIESSWGRETVIVAWRKVMDVIATADSNAKEGVQFRVPDESSEERYRRLLGELKEVEGDLPVELVNSILGDVGYQVRSTVSELNSVDERLKSLQKDQQEAVVESPVPQDEVLPDEAPQEEGGDSQVENPEVLMQNRRPLNQQVTHVPVPQQANPVEPAIRPAKVPEQIRRAAAENAAVMRTPRVGRSAEIAALESEAGSLFENDAAQLPRKPHREEVAELSQRVTGIDGKVLRTIVDSPPVAGINPRFKPRV